MVKKKTRDKGHIYTHDIAKNSLFLLCYNLDNVQLICTLTVPDIPHSSNVLLSAGAYFHRRNTDERSDVTKSFDAKTNYIFFNQRDVNLKPVLQSQQDNHFSKVKFLK